MAEAQAGRGGGQGSVMWKQTDRVMEDSLAASELLNAEPQMPSS